MKTNSMTRTASWAVMAMAAVNTNAGASITNGFEAPAFATGSIFGQQGWEATSLTATVSTANARSGSQHLRLEVAPSTVSVQAFGPTALPAGSPSMSMTFSVEKINSILSVSGVSSSFQTSWGLILSSGSVYLFENSNWIDSGADISGTGVYQQFATVYNPGDQSRDYYLNGALFYHQTSGLAAGLTTDFLNISLSSGAGDHVDIDDIGTYAVPAPGSIALACMGGLIAGRRRR